MWQTVMSRPDIANAVRAVARHSHNPAGRHWKEVLMVVENLLGTKDLWSCVQTGVGNELVGVYRCELRREGRQQEVCYGSSGYSRKLRGGVAARKGS